MKKNSLSRSQNKPGAKILTLNFISGLVLFERQLYLNTFIL
ncbi:hypothetical protein HMPREF9104_01536 [Lentilactobacillus kisonensis F0435]|uniref:Uncharacterized protein n=1 Tax=Lentilactobacillus kisonensis F0435 TaxID=797516 RepID=H1LG10_9LACO|nr:hypothetical protein HMPREF9104_01536 [Lentilactobacillus kisonensis F0435]